MLQQYFQNIKGDKVIWLVVVMLSVFSLLAVYSAIGTLAYSEKKGTDFYLIKQIMIMGAGFVMMYATHRLHYKYYARIAQILLVIAVPLLLYTLFFGTNKNEASRWITLPIVNLTFQSSDVAKLALMMYLAKVLAERQTTDYDFKDTLLNIILPVMGICILIFPANLSTAAVLFVTSLLVMFIGRIKILHLLGVAGITLAGIAIVLLTIMFMPNKGRLETWKSRIENFGDSKDVPFQVQQAKIAIAKGYPVGKGPGNSTQRNYLPHPYSDFIFAIIIEEYGLPGAFVIMLLYIIFLFRCVKIVIKSPKAFGALLAVGLGISLVLQAFIHMAVNVNLLPVTGLTLPLVSMGGTSLFFTSIAIGIILSVSRHIEEEGEAVSLKVVNEKA